MNEQSIPPTPPVTEGSEARREMRTRGQRRLFINVMLMFLVSIVVFVVGTSFFVVPRLIAQNMEIRHLQARLSALQAAPSAEEPAEEPAEAEDPSD